jgi:hypothetical protein
MSTDTTASGTIKSNGHSVAAGWPVSVVSTPEKLL